MWTVENRKRYDRSQLRYPSDLTDDEWRLIEPLIRPAMAHNLIRKAPGKDSLRLKRKVAAWDDEFLVSLIAA